MNDSVKKTDDEQAAKALEQTTTDTGAPAEAKPRRRRVTAKSEAPADEVSASQAAADEPAKPKAKRAPAKKKAVVATDEPASQAQLFAQPEAVAQDVVAEPKKRSRAKPKAVEQAADEVAETVIAPVVVDVPAPAAQELQEVTEVPQTPRAAVEAASEQQSDSASEAVVSGEQAQQPERERRQEGRRGDRNASREPREPREGGQQQASRRGPGQQQQRRAEGRPAAPGDVSYKFEDIVSGQLDRDEEDEAVAPVKRVLPPQAETPKLHKVLAQAGIGSRLEMEQLILEGRISVNNEPAHVGQRVQFGDQIKVNGKPIRFRIEPPPARVIAYHKPVGEVVTHDDPQNRPTVFRRLPRLHQGKWQSVGRLDLNTEGLLLFTSSGELANKLMHPRFGLEREYAVRVLGALSNDEKERLMQGVQLEDGSAQFGSIEDGGGEGANHWYRVTISEGRNREVRRMLESVGHAVSRLIRIRYGAMMLPRGLKRGAWLELDERDIRSLMQAAGAGGMIDAQQPQQQPGAGRGANNRGRGGNSNRGASSGAGGRGERSGGSYFQGTGGGGGGGDRRSAGGPNRDRNGGGGAGGAGGGGGRGGDRSGGSSQPDPMKTSVGYIGGDSLSRHRQQQRNNGGPRRRDR